MTMNDFLCAHFAHDRKGKVRINHITNIVLPILGRLILFAIIVMFIGAVVTLIGTELGIVDDSVYSSFEDDGTLKAALLSVGYLFITGLCVTILCAIILAILLLFLIALEAFLNIEIATCPVTEKKEEEPKEEEKK